VLDALQECNNNWLDASAMVIRSPPLAAVWSVPDSGPFRTQPCGSLWTTRGRRTDNANSGSYIYDSWFIDAADIVASLASNLVGVLGRPVDTSVKPPISRRLFVPSSLMQSEETRQDRDDQVSHIVDRPFRPRPMAFRALTTTTTTAAATAVRSW